MGISLAVTPDEAARRKRIPQVGGLQMYTGPMANAGGARPAVQRRPLAPIDTAAQPLASRPVRPAGPGGGPASMPQRPIAPVGPTAPTQPVGAVPPSVPRPAPVPQPNGFGPGNDLRFQTIAPAQSARGVAAAGRTDVAANRVAGSNPVATVGQYADDMAARLTPRAVGFQGVDPNVGRRAVDPRVGFQDVDTELDPGAAVNPADSADLAKFRGLRSGAADALTSGPTRSEIAKRELQAFDMESQPGIRDQMRAVGQRAAALGRTGMGETSLEASQPFIDYLTRRAALETRLAGQTAEGEIADRQRVLDSARGLVGEEEGLEAGRRGELRTDRAYDTAVRESNIGRAIGERDTALGLAERNVGRDLGLAGEEAALEERNVGRRTGERDTALGLDERNVGRDYDARRAALEAGIGLSGMESEFDLSRLGALSGIEDNIYARDAADRNEQRGERDYQFGVGERATDRAIQGRQMENQELDDDFRRTLQAEALRMGVDPSATYMNASGNLGRNADAAYGGAADLLSQYMARRRRQPEGG